MTADPHAPFFDTVESLVRERLVAIAERVSQAVDGAQACVSYNMPAFRLGKVFFYFGAFNRHIGIYPPVSAPSALADRLQGWRGPKGNLAFPHDEPLPLDLIEEVAGALALQYGSTGEK